MPAAHESGAAAEGASYRSAAQQALLGVVERLAARPLEPATAERLAAGLGGVSRDQAFRALKNLEAAGWAEQAPAGGWRLTPMVIRLADQFRRALVDAHRLYLGDCM